MFFLEEEHETARITEKQNYKIYIYILYGARVEGALLVQEERLGARERNSVKQNGTTWKQQQQQEFRN